MSKTKVVLNIPAFQAMRVDAQAQAMVRAEGEKIQGRAGPEFDVEVTTGKTSVARVFPNSFDGILAEAKHGALSKAVGSGG